MGFDQKGAPVFCITAGHNGEWHVSEQGFEKPIATFQSRPDAEEYARDLARTKEGSTVRMPEDVETPTGDMTGQSQTMGGGSQQQTFGRRMH